MEVTRELTVEVVDRRAGGSPSQRLLWQRAHHAIAGTYLAQTTQIQLLEAAPSPSALEAFATLLQRALAYREEIFDDAANRVWEHLVEAIDDSEETLPAWLAALEVFFRWTEAKGLNPHLNGATGFLHCSALAVGTADHYPSFPVAVQTMLDTYGYAGEEGTCG